jgi:hypothetical protein
MRAEAGKTRACHDENRPDEKTRGGAAEARSETDVTILNQWA